MMAAAAAAAVLAAVAADVMAPEPVAAGAW